VELAWRHHTSDFKRSIDVLDERVGARAHEGVGGAVKRVVMGVAWGNAQRCKVNGKCPMLNNDKHYVDMTVHVHWVK